MGITDICNNRKLAAVLTILIIVIIYMMYITVYGNDSGIANNDTSNTELMEQREIGTWRHNGDIENLSRRLHNNVWGATDKEKKSSALKSYIYYKFNGNFGWEWDRPSPDSGGKRWLSTIYPEVVVGVSGSYSSTSPYFPVKLNNIYSLETDVEYMYVKNTTGIYNLAYDIFLVDESGIKKAEVMVWLYGSSNETIDKLISDGINEYEYSYRPLDGVAPGWSYHVLVLKKQSQILLNRPVNNTVNYTVNIKALLDELVKYGRLSNEWVVDGVEFGNEVWIGSGKIEISKFSVVLNGKEI